MVYLIVKSGVKEQFEGYNVSADLYETLDDAVADVLDQAAERAEANDRKTVQRQDLSSPHIGVSGCSEICRIWGSTIAGFVFQTASQEI